MNNEHGLDVDYFRKNLEMILRDIDNYTPAEMFRALIRLGSVAGASDDEVTELMLGLRASVVGNSETEDTLISLSKILTWK